tara:strand:- start:383 stop:580 length:198 start_codon:yes stop_codon:yes gene_type:complete
VKVGDLIKWYAVKNDAQREFGVEYGIILSLSRSGATSLHAQVLFEDNTIEWIPENCLEVINDNAN